MRSKVKVAAGSLQGATKETAMKTYYGHTATDEHEAEVWVRRDHLIPLPHHVLHSESGFAWGSVGSGPIELARCLLMDAFGSKSCPDAPDQCHCVVEWVSPSYLAYQTEVVSKLPEDQDWKLGQAEVLDWVFDYLDAVRELPTTEEPPLASATP